MSSPRQFHGATALYDGTVLLAGGTNGSATLDTVEIFDPTSDGGVGGA